MQIVAGITDSEPAPVIFPSPVGEAGPITVGSQAIPHPLSEAWYSTSKVGTHIFGILSEYGCNERARLALSPPRLA